VRNFGKNRTDLGHLCAEGGERKKTLKRRFLWRKVPGLFGYKEGRGVGRNRGKEGRRGVLLESHVPKERRLRSGEATLFQPAGRMCKKCKKNSRGGTGGKGESLR